MNLRRTVFFWVSLLTLAFWVFLGEGFKVYPGLPSPGQLSLFLTGALLLLQPANVWRKVNDPTLSLLLGSGSIALAWAVVRGEPLRLLYQDGVPLLAFVVAVVGVGLLPKPGQRRWFVIAMVIGSLATLKTLAAWFHGQYGISWENQWQTYASLGDSLGRIILRGGGIMMLASLVFWVALLSTDSAGRSPALNRIAWVGFHLAAVGVYFKQTRSDLVGLLAMAGFLFLRRVFAGKRIIPRLPVPAVGALLVAILLGGTLLMARISSTEESVTFRIVEVRGLFAEQPIQGFILGGGFGQPSAGGRDMGPTLYSHNYIIALLLKWGLAGAVAFHVLLLGRPREGPANPIDVGVTAVVIALLAHGLLANQFASPTAPFLLGAAAALRNGGEE